MNKGKNRRRLETSNDGPTSANEDLPSIDEGLETSREELQALNEAALARAKEEWERTFDAVPDLIALIDNAHRILRVNRAMARRLDLEPEECIGLSCHESVHGLFGPPGSCPHAQTMKDRQRHVAEVHEERLGGDFLVSTTPLLDERGEMLGSVHVAHDITEHKRAERRIDLLTEIAGELLRTDSPQALVESLCRKVMAFLDCQAFFNFLVDEGAGRLHLNACAGIPEEEARRIEWLDYGVAVCGCAARDRCRIVAEDIQNTADPRTELVKSYGIQAYACHPLVVQDRLLGTLSFGTRTRTRFSDEDLSLMKAVADQVAIAMERKRAEEALRQGEERLKRAQEIAHLGSWELDLVHNRLSWSDEVYRIFGLHPQEFEATYEAFLDTVHPEDRAAVDAAYSGSLAEGRDTYEIEHRVVRRRTGEVRTVHEKCEHLRDEAGRIVRSVGMVHDVTERKRAEEALRHRESILAQAGKMANLGAWEIEVSDQEGVDAGRLRWSDEVYRIFGFTPGEVEVTNEFFFARVPPEDHARIQEAVAQAIALRQPYSIEHRIVRPDGAERIVLEHAEISFDDRGRPARFIGAVQDITERKHTEQALRQAVEAADTANRAKSEFLARMSHEIRTPMNGVMGMTDLVLLEPHLPGKTREYLRIAKQSAKALLDIINDILDIAKIEAGRAELAEEPFDLRQCLQAVMSTLDVAAGNKDLSLTLRVDPDVPSLVLGDEGRLRQVLVNLVGNAVKFTEQGEVGVLVGLAEAGMLGSWEAGTRGEHPGVQASKRPGGVRLLFAVRDTGIGIPPENLSSLFESFSQATRSTHAKYGGTGLGLSIARQLVDLMGGRIWAESQPGTGSIFRFMVELSEASEPTIPADGEPEPGSGWTVRPLRVLLAEDNPVNQLLVRELLSQDGHEVVVAEDGRAALEALSREPFDVVLMDVQMPEMDGMEATRLIRDGTLPRIPRGIPVVALTAHALRGDRERFLDAGMDEYLSKPIRLEEFYRVLARVGSRSRNCE